MPAALKEIEQGIIAVIKSVVDAGEQRLVVVRDADFNITKEGWQSVLIADDAETVHAIVVSLIGYGQTRNGSSKTARPMFGVDFMRQYEVGAAQRAEMYDEFEAVGDAISANYDLGLQRRIAGHDELQGANMGTRTIVGVKLRIFPTTLTVINQPKDVNVIRS